MVAIGNESWEFHCSSVDYYSRYVLFLVTIICFVIVIMFSNTFFITQYNDFQYGYQRITWDEFQIVFVCVIKCNTLIINAKQNY